MSVDPVALRAWLLQAGAVVLDTTNPYEVVRFRSNSQGKHGCVNIIYRRENGHLTCVGNEAAKALHAFQAKLPWSFQSVYRQRPSTQLRMALLARDGADCWYCGRPLEDDCTVEHLVPVSFGGPNHKANLALAHERCNKDGGHLSVAEKAALRDRMRVTIGLDRYREEELTA